MGNWAIRQGDALGTLKGMPDASFDAVPCDPPYGLRFMGKEWDHGVPSMEVWAEALRVLKPGAFLLAFGGTRTFHRLTCAIEDAGFEIRDCAMWLYGSGFPKSMDISKALDKAGGASPREQANLLRSKREAAGLSREEVADRVGCTQASVRDWEDGRSRATGKAVEWITPSERYRGKLADLLGYSADERRMVGVSADRRGDGTVIGLGHSGVKYGEPATDAARTWEGYGTALKPAWEPCIVAMKPLDGTFAQNALKHGVAGLNIEAGRIGTEARSYLARGMKSLVDQHSENDRPYTAGLPNRNEPLVSVEGRWPANLILDAEAGAMLDAQTGDRSSTRAIGNPNNPKRGGNSTPTWGLSDGRETHDYRDTGGASRFFYCAKASRRERDAGLDGFEKSMGLAACLAPLSDPRMNGPQERRPMANHHPCLKPLDLCRHLASLILPPKRDTPRCILVPFSGSGSEMIGALQAGWDEAVGLEMEADYVAIAEARLAHWIKCPEDFEPEQASERVPDPEVMTIIEPAKPPVEDFSDLPLFGMTP